MYNIVGQKNKSSHSSFSHTQSGIWTMYYIGVHVCVYDVIKELYGLCEIYVGNDIIVFLFCKHKIGIKRKRNVLTLNLCWS